MQILGQENGEKMEKTGENDPGYNLWKWTKVGCRIPSDATDIERSKKAKKIAKRMAYACVCHFFLLPLHPILIWQNIGL